MVGRLSQQLADLQRTAAIAAPPLAAEAGTAPPPPWLTDAETMNPLLLAYDGKVERLEEELAEKKAQLAKLQSEVESSTAEVDTLHSQLKDAMSLVADSVRSPRHSCLR